MAKISQKDVNSIQTNTIHTSFYKLYLFNNIQQQKTMHRKGFPFMTQHKNIRDFNESPFPTLFNGSPYTATYKKKQEKTFFQEFHIKRQSMRMLPSTLHYFCSNRVFYLTEAPPLSQYNLQLSYTTIALILLI